jgi:hypothetical protein
MTNRDDISGRSALSPSALNRRGELKGLRLPPDMSLLFERGDRHEDAVVAGLVAEGRDLVALEDEDASPDERAQRTIAAMRDGREPHVMGRTHGHQWGEKMAADGENRWP